MPLTPLRAHGPWATRELIGRPVTPLPLRRGCYIAAVAKELYDPERHGASRFVYIGGMKNGENSSLSKRVGEFFASSLGFATYHSGGNTFFARREQHGIGPWDLELWWYEFEDPMCLEPHLFTAYLERFGRLPLINSIRQRKGCCGKLCEMTIEVPWQT